MPTLVDLVMCLSEGHIPWIPEPMKFITLNTTDTKNSQGKIIASMKWCSRCRLGYIEFPEEVNNGIGTDGAT